MVTVTQSVPCERCGRTVRVALSSLRPPSFDQIDEQVRAFVRERPVVALFGAVGIGYFVARALSRL